MIVLISFPQIIKSLILHEFVTYGNKIVKAHNIIVDRKACGHIVFAKPIYNKQWSR